jgi:hypothetical protein
MNVHGKAITAVSPANRRALCALVPTQTAQALPQLIRFLEYFYAVAQFAVHGLDAR